MFCFTFYFIIEENKIWKYDQRKQLKARESFKIEKNWLTEKKGEHGSLPLMDYGVSPSSMVFLISDAQL